MSNIKGNIESIKNDIKKYAEYPKRVKLVAVTKYVQPEVMDEVLACGVNVFGENKVQVIKEKYERYTAMGINDIEWHFIGNLQTNKVKYIAPFITLIHSLNRLSLAEEINKRALENNRVIDVLIEINLIGESTKHGYSLKTLYAELPELLKLKNINIIGLMTMAPFTDDQNYLRTIFRKLKEVKEDLNLNVFKTLQLTQLSMGMSNDYKLALEEGATIIRVGRKIYE